MSNPSDPNQPGGWGQSPQPGWGQPQQPGGWDQPAPPPPGGGGAPGGWQQPFPGGSGGGSGWDQRQGQGAYGAPPGYQAYSGYGGGGYGGGSGELAGWWLRVGATLIDGIVLFVISLILTVAAGIAGRIIGGLAGLIYYVALIGSRGQTLGNMATGTKVVNSDTGQNLGYGWALLRWFVTLVLTILLFIPELLDVLWPLWDEKNQTIHDKAASSVVIRTN